MQWLHFCPARPDRLLTLRLLQEPEEPRDLRIGEKFLEFISRHRRACWSGLHRHDGDEPVLREREPSDIDLRWRFESLRPQRRRVVVDVREMRVAGEHLRPQRPPEEPLDLDLFESRSEEMRRPRMTEEMIRDPLRDPCPSGRALDDVQRAVARHATSAPRGEERRLGSLVRVCLEPRRQRGRGLDDVAGVFLARDLRLPEPHDVELSAPVLWAVRLPDIREVQGKELMYPDPEVPQTRDERAIADGRRRFDHRLHVGGREDVRRVESLESLFQDEEFAEILALRRLVEHPEEPDVMRTGRHLSEAGLEVREVPLRRSGERLSEPRLGLSELP